MMAGLVCGQRGFQRIIKFSEVPVGEQFASSKTGQVMRKSAGISNYRGDKTWEWFDPDDLVYVDGNLHGGCLY